MFNLARLLRRDEDVDELDPSARRVDVWAPAALTACVIVAKLAADLLVERHGRLCDQLAAVRAEAERVTFQLGEADQQLDELTAERDTAYASARRYAAMAGAEMPEPVDAGQAADVALADPGQDKPAGVDEHDDTGPAGADWRAPLVDEPAG